MRGLLVLVLAVLAGPAQAGTAVDSLAQVRSKADALLAAEWKKAHLAPAPAVDDTRFLRRLYLDLVGVIPPPEVVHAFLEDTRPGKRERAIEGLLDSPGWADHFTDVWERLFIGRALKGARADHASFRAWLRDALARNLRWDAVARQLLTAVGDTDKDGATNFFLRYADSPTDLTGKVARTFLGVQVQCAQCHDHPTEKWKRDDFRRLAACFVRTVAQPIDPKGMAPKRFAVRDFPIAVAGLKKASDPDLRAIEEARPAALDGTDFTGADDRRAAFADWLLRPQNPWFARAQVNRVWALLVGRGFVEPLDDFRDHNPAVAPAVLDLLARDFSQSGYDLKRLVRVIVGTRAYQLAAAPPARGSAADAERLFARHPLLPLGPEELYASLAQATHVEPVFQKFAGANFEKQKMQLRNQVTFLFDVDEEADPTIEEVTVPQALLLLNGPLANAGASALPGTALSDLLAMPVSDEAKLEELYLRTLSRRPTRAELTRLVAFLRAPRAVVETRKGATPPSPLVQAYEDVFWAILNSSEFQMRH
jgi:hypothetical protein